MTSPTVMWWVRRDLRVGDNPALVEAAKVGDVLPVFVLDDRLWGPSGDARRAFLVGCLESLRDATDGALVVRHGEPADELATLARSVEATDIFAAKDFGPYGHDRDAAVAAAVEDLLPGAIHWVGSPYAIEPGTVNKGDGTPFRVFTPFSRAWRSVGWEPPYEDHPEVRWATHHNGSAMPKAPRVDAALPEPGEPAGRARWADFRDGALAEYADRRDRPDIDGTSHMSAYLKWGCVHPRTLLSELSGTGRGKDAYRTELCWREFYADVLWHRPDSARSAYNESMAGMQIDAGGATDAHFEAWAAGRTGYPIVDAGMRQLLAEGWMHNRLRMITASFLVKDLHLDWTRGARHFLEHLVDGDLASNNHGWQWVAGTGTDAAPYFRVFNPITQGEKFDPSGDYVRHHVPELRAVGGRAVHQPWDLGDGFPEGYPERIVDHKEERAEALRRYGEVRS